VQGDDVSGKNVLAVGAHPDDVEILCSGTLAKLANAGHRVTVAHVTNGDVGHYQIPAKELAEIREREAAEAARVIGAASIGLGFHDFGVYDDWETLHRFADVIRRVKPDVIITHGPADYLMEHIKVGQITVAASYAAGCPNIKTDREFHDAIPPIFFMDTIGAIDFKPSDYVDVTDVMDIKRKALAKHESQLKWMKERWDTDLLELMEAVSRSRGVQSGVKYAEAFARYQVYGRCRAESTLAI
jgi:LmbE family N-acetylglucosaminyl deacetylase